MYNKVFLIGNLTRDPEMRYTTSGIPVTRFTLAVNRRFKSADGQGQDVDFIKVVAWRKLAEFCGNYLTKGKPVSVEGRLQLDEYEVEGKKKYSSEVYADGLQILSKKGESDFADTEPKATKSSGSGDEDIPF